MARKIFFLIDLLSQKLLDHIEKPLDELEPLRDLDRVVVVVEEDLHEVLAVVHVVEGQVDGLSVGPAVVLAQRALVAGEEVVVHEVLARVSVLEQLLEHGQDEVCVSVSSMIISSLLSVICLQLALPSRVGRSGRSCLILPTS